MCRPPQLERPSDDVRLEPHDRNQLELKLAYIAPGEARVARYHVETFMFVPKTLGIDRHSFHKDQFYAETATFLRLKTPVYSLHDLSQNGAHEWFGAFLKGQQNPKEDTARQVRRLKVIGCIYRSALRDEFLNLQDTASRADQPGLLVERGAQTLVQIDQAITRLAELDREATIPSSAPVVGSTWAAVDEYIAWETEELCTALVQLLEQAAPEGKAKGHIALRDRAAKQAVDRYEHRRQRGYPSVVAKEGPNESLPYRKRILKRIITSALYLDVRKEEGGRYARDLVGMIAAALAMLFAVMVLLWAQASMEMFSVSFVAVMVASYMIKDRIKEWGRQSLGRRAARFLPDSEVRVYNRAGTRVVGRCRESFRVLRSAQVPEDVLQLRRAHLKNEIAEDGRPETVVHYDKDLVLQTGGLQDEMQGFAGVNDIIRFNLDRIRSRMDAPLEVYTHLHPHTHQLVTVECARVYHLHFILKLTARTGDATKEKHSHVRVVMDQSGIKRIEPLRDDLDLY